MCPTIQKKKTTLFFLFAIRTSRFWRCYLCFFIIYIFPLFAFDNLVIDFIELPYSQCSLNFFIRKNKKETQGKLSDGSSHYKSSKQKNGGKLREKKKRYIKPHSLEGFPSPFGPVGEDLFGWFFLWCSGRGRY